MSMILFALCFAVAAVNAVGDWTGASCLFAAGYLTWPPCDPSVEYYACILATPQQLGTAAICMDTFASDPESAWREAMDYPSSSVFKPLLDQYAVVLENATRNMVDFPANTSDTLFAPVNMTLDFFQPIWDAERTWDISEIDYPWAFAWVFLMFALMAVVLAMARYAWLSFRSHRSSESSQPKASKLGIYTKRYLLMPAIWHSTAHRPSLFGFTFSIPTRMQSVLVFLLVMINAIGCGWQLQLIPNNIYFEGNKWLGAVRYVADRTGMFAVFNLPLMFAFAGRNNILIWLTGSTFDTFNVFHKWLARIVVAEAIVHSVLYTVDIVYYGAAELKEDYLQPYLRWGAVATVAGGLILIQAVHLARKHYYETFLILHVVLAILFIVGTWYHIYLLDLFLRPKWNNYLAWMVAACVIWALDRLVRLIRILYYNFSYRQGALHITSSTIKALPGNLYQINVTLGRSWQFVPGQYCFVHFGKRHHFLQSHPFTIVSYEEESTYSNTPPMAREDSKSAISEDKRKVLTLVVRRHKGITKQLQNLSLGTPSLALIEGPYGHGLPIDNYDNLTFLSGGIGITAILSHCRLALGQYHRSIHLIWIVHSSDEVSALWPHILKCQNSNLELSVFVTSGKDSKELDAIAHEKVFQRINLNFSSGRPEIEGLLRQDSSSAGSWAVVACGPGGMLDDARAACVAILGTKKEPVDFYSEGFEW